MLEINTKADEKWVALSVKLHNQTPFEIEACTYNQTDPIKLLSYSTYNLHPNQLQPVVAMGYNFINVEIKARGSKMPRLDAQLKKGQTYIIDNNHEGQLIVRVWKSKSFLQKSLPTAEPLDPQLSKSLSRSSIQLGQSETPGGPAEAIDFRMCKICMEGLISSMLYPCGHCVACDKCLEAFKNSECPICREKVTDVKRLYWA